MAQSTRSSRSAISSLPSATTNAFQGKTGSVEFDWDGTRSQDNGGGNGDHRKVVPNGRYILKLSVLKALGDAGNPADWESVRSVVDVGGGADVAIEALGLQETFENSLRCLRPGGTLVAATHGRGVFLSSLTAAATARAAATAASSWSVSVGEASAAQKMMHNAKKPEAGSLTPEA